MSTELNEIFNIANKTVLITGATGFFGRHMSRSFIEAGAKVILLGRSKKLLDQAADLSNRSNQSGVFAFQVDFYDQQELEKTLNKVIQKHSVDVLINNAFDFSKETGFNTPEGTIDKLTHKNWGKAFESGLYWAVKTTQVIGKQMQARRRGSIINISSMYGIVAPSPHLYAGTRFFNPPTYSVVKSGLIGLTRYTASFWGKYGIRCNAVLPGAFSNTESKGPNSVNPHNPFLKRLCKRTVLNRVGHPDDLRGLLIYLASDASSYMTGQSIIIDGGWTTT
ncbi:MAG TPA: SDR family oxidoreductase [Elusimicrobiota bacterium]|nr:SDR family oxidoreductase [Elusimicrobiota bacterium]